MTSGDPPRASDPPADAPHGPLLPYSAAPRAPDSPTEPPAAPPTAGLRPIIPPAAVPDDDAPLVPPPPKRRVSPWIWAFPTCGCLLVICVLVSGVAALFASGRATEIGTAWGAPRLPRPWESQAPPVAPTSPSVAGQPTPRPTVGGYPSPGAPVGTPRPPAVGTTTPGAATSTPSTGGAAPTTTPSSATATPAGAGTSIVVISQVARLTSDGQRQPAGTGAQNVVVPADNRGVAVQVQFQQVPRGFSGQLVTAWNRTSGTPSALRPPETTQVTDIINGTTWWFSYRAEEALPPGQYEFAVALTPANGGPPNRQTVRFEVR